MVLLFLSMVCANSSNQHYTREASIGDITLPSSGSDSDGFIPESDGNSTEEYSFDEEKGSLVLHRERNSSQ